MSHSVWKPADATELARLAAELLEPSRELPVVAVTTRSADGRPWIDPAALAADLEGRARVVLLETGDATWALTAALPRRLDVYGGALRIWWPGLAADSDPFDHPLILVHDDAGAARVRGRILAAIGGGAAATRTPLAPPPGPRGPIVERGARRGDSADAWRRIAEEYLVGDVVPGRVFKLFPYGAIVELLPGAGVLVPLQELDYEWVDDPRDVLSPGERVEVELLELDPGAQRGRASLKRAHGREARAGIALRPGEASYVGQASADEGGAAASRAARREGEARARLAAELESLGEDRRRLAVQCEELKRDLADARKDRRSAQDRVAFLERRLSDVDPLSSENAFLAAVRVEHARRFDEGDRFDYPLARMRLGRVFLERVRRLEGVDVEKVVEVCAQVASGRAHETPGRAVHELTDGDAGRVRRADGAKAWRCALQVNTPSARRLHWWRIPGRGDGGATIEFASVAVHDDFSIPE